MDRKDRFSRITEWFSGNMEIAETELHYDTPFHLLIAVILSAQCTDRRVNMHTPVIFERFPEPADLAAASFEEVYELIKSISFPNNKARHLIGMAKMLVSDFGSEVPSEPSELEKLPGVGRKTANLTVAVGFNLPAICVDVHVHRICNWLKLIKTKTPLESEMALRKILPVKYWKTWNSHLVSFGQTRCNPVRPKCVGCPIAEFCESPKKRA